MHVNCSTKAFKRLTSEQPGTGGRHRIRHSCQSHGAGQEGRHCKPGWEEERKMVDGRQTQRALLPELAHKKEAKTTSNSTRWTTFRAYFSEDIVMCVIIIRKCRRGSVHTHQLKPTFPASYA